jgi:glycerol-3-phosphate acyltransferase PlsY
VRAVETFTLVEWLRMPFDVIGIHQWEGQSRFLILAPMVLSVAVGFAFLFWKFKPLGGVAVFLGVFAGLLYIGSGFMMSTQLLMALFGSTSTSSAVLTAVFAILPIILGFFMIKKIISDGSSFNLKDRVIMLAFGILGLVLWSGLLVGPALSIIVSIIPAVFFS